MKTFVVNAIFIGFCWSVAAQQQSPDDCLMKCTNEHYRKAPRSDPMKMMNVQSIRVGNTTAMCPKMNNTDNLEEFCAPMKDLKQCVETCPDTPIKKLTMSGFKLLQFFCVDRFNDIKKNMPCLSEACPDVQTACIPKCGAIEEHSKKISNLIHDVQSGAGKSAAGNGTVAGGTPQDVDMNTITQVIADTCTRIDCFVSCSEAPVTKRCGKDAYLLQRDLIWNMFASVAQSMSSIGIQTQWPDQCRPLASATTNTGTGAAQPGTEAAAGVATGTTSAVHGRVENGTTLAPPGETRVAKVDGTKVKCDGPSCGAAASLVPTVALLIVAAVLAF